MFTKLLFKPYVFLFIFLSVVGCSGNDSVESSESDENAQETAPAWEPVDPDYVDEDD